MQHPCGIEPWGNFYMRGGGPNIRDAGLGVLSTLSDAVLLDIFGQLGPKELGCVALASKAAYCFANQEDLWKSLVIEEMGGRFTWSGCWQRTYLVTKGWVAPQDGQPDSDSDSDSDSDEEEGQEDGRQQQQQEEEADKGEVEARHGAKGKRGKRAAAAAAAAAAADGGEACKGKGGKGRKDAGEKAGTGRGCERRGSKRLKTDGGAEAVGSEGVGNGGKKGKAQEQHEQSGGKGGKQGTGKDKREGRAAAKGEAKGRAQPNGSEAVARGSGCEGAQNGGCDAGGPRRLMRRVRGGGAQRYLCCRGMYSDLLYQPWFCATLEPPADWLEVDNIDRRRNLTPEQFRQEYEIPNRPVILQGVMDDWPAMAKWSAAYFKQLLGDKDVTVGNMPMPFSTYAAYCASNHDEMPLYLFDQRFSDPSRHPSLGSDYTVPGVFGEDLFALLGETQRPDYRWLILGPARSGSSFHVDPNATSAWNALVWGAKKWVLYPPGAVPPGVHPSPDGADVATPVSLTEWFVNFYAATRETKVRPVECVARPGELLFVPRGWWHCALNLEESCAITQNFVSEVGLQAVLAFLKSRRPELVSGCAHENRSSLYDRFVAALREHRPHVLAGVEAKQEAARAKAREANRLASLFKQPGEQQQQQGGEGCGLAGSGAAGAGCGGGDGGEREKDKESGAGGFSFGFAFGGGGAGGDVGPGESGAAGGFKFGFSM